MNDLTCVVTSWKRPASLKRALRSLAVAKVSHVVVAVAASDPGVAEVIASFHKKFQTLRVTALETDLGISEMMLRGLYHATTRFVMFLSDDNRVMKCWGPSVEESILPQLRSGRTGFALWAAKHVSKKRPRKSTAWTPRSTQVMSTATLSDRLKSGSFHDISLSCAILDRVTAIEALKDWRTHYAHFNSAMSNTRELGIATVVLLRHCQTYTSMVWHAGRLTEREIGPTTLRAVSTASGRDKKGREHVKKLMHSRWTVSDNVRTRFVAAWAPPPKVHERDQRAMDSWIPAIDTGAIMPFVFVPEQMGYKSSKHTFGDPRALACVTDVFDYLRRFILPEDYMIFMNNDCGLIHGREILLRQELNRREVAYCWRATLGFIPAGPVTDFAAGFEDGGADLFAIRGRWWDRHRHAIPRLYVGCTGWDVVYRVVMEDYSRAHGGEWPGLKRIIWHANHVPMWATKDMRKEATNSYNRDTVKVWLRNNGHASLENLVENTAEGTLQHHLDLHDDNSHVL